MEITMKSINELLKKKSRIGKSDSLEAAKLIYQIYCSNQDCEMLVKYLYDFYYKVAGIFVSKYYFEVSVEERTQIIQSFLKNKKFYNNQSGASLYRGFAILAGIICKEIADDNVLPIINNLTKIAEKNNAFNATSCKIFADFLNLTYDKFFDLDFSSLLDNELRRLFRYISSTISDISTISYGNKIQVWAEKYSFIFPKQTIVDNVEDKEISIALNKTEKISKTSESTVLTNTVKFAELDSTKELIKTLKSANQEAQKLFDSIFNKNNIIQNFQEKLNAKEKQMNLLKIEIQNKNAKITSLNGQLNKVETELADREMKISDLIERLKISFNADDISKKQELITLKNDIATAVKLQYEDFIEIKNESYNEDNHEALKGMLNQVFRTLKRYGIEL
ncbi:MAG: hypothetical protein KAX49_17775 [Halanaerobiales bacterium]|nr:hypothetical protein [Halanaerobiales bacterium]